MERTELNSNEKLALNMTGMEGTGEHFVVNDKSADQMIVSDKVNKFNSCVDKYVDKFEKHNQNLQDYAKSISEDINGLEIMPMFSYALIKPFDNNPFQQIKISKGGLFEDLGGFTPEYKSNETGQIEEEQQYIKVGTVIEVGHKCEFLKPGDIVFYTIASECMVPFFKQGFVVVSEQRIMAVVNSELTKRRDEIKNK